MDLRTLAIFVKAAEERNFTRAARSFGITTSAVSNAVTRLEGRMGVQLLARSTRSVSLTTDGTTFYAHCRHALQEIEEAERLVSRARRKPQGLLRIDLPFTFGRVKIIPMLDGFLKQFPDIRIEISLSDRVADFVESGKDLALRFGAIRDTGLIARPLTQLQMRICGSPAYFSKHGIPKSPKDLDRHDCIPYVKPRSRTVAEWRLRGETGSDRIKLSLSTANSRLSIDNADALVSAATAGLGVVQVVSYLVDDEIAAGRLVSVLDEYMLPGVPMSIVYPYSRHISPRVRALADYLIANYR